MKFFIERRWCGYSAPGSVGYEKVTVIQKLRNNDGQLCTKIEDMQSMATYYFQTLYTKDPTITPEYLLLLIDTRVDDEVNIALCKDFMDEED